MTGAPEYSAPSNTLTPDQLSQFQEEARIQQEKIEKTQTESKLAVETAIKKQQEIYEEEIKKAKEAEVALKGKNVYYKVVQEQEVEKTQEIENLKVQAEANPKNFIEDTAKEFEKEPVVRDLKTDEVKLGSEQAAITTYEVLTDESPLVEAAVIHGIVSSPKILHEIVPDTETQKNLQDAASFLVDKNKFQFELSKHFINLSKVDGFTKIEDIKVEFSDTPKEGYKEFNLNQHIIAPHLDNLGDSNFLVGNLKNIGEGQIKSQVLSSASTNLAKFIARQPANSFLAQAYNSEAVQLGLSYLGLAPAVPWIAAEGSWFGQLAVSSGFGPVAGFVQTKLGINLGVQMAAKVVGSKVAGTVTGEVVAGAVGGEVTGAAVGAAAGSVVPIVGTIVGLVAGLVGPKVVGFIKDNVQKYGKYVIVAAGAGLGLLFGGVLGAALGGILAFGGISLLSGGLPALSSSMVSLGSGIAGFFGALGGATLGAIGIPILVTLIGFPVVVALILFIINSGAYVVPTTGIAGVTCNIDQNNEQVSQTHKSTASDAAVCIVFYLNKYNLNPLLVSLLSAPSWQNLVKVLPSPALEALQISAPIDGHLQCVGFAAATAGWAYGQAFSQINACSYINNPPAGYGYISGTKGIQSGDFFLINGSNGCSPSSPGHIGVVVSVDGALISCADANMVGPGEARVANGCFALSQITGYMRR
jgi:hypothetical protein